jgi:hypothetical protein
MKYINKQSAKSSTIFIIIVLIMITGIISIIYNPSFKKQSQIKWEMLQAQQASLNALALAKEILYSNSLTQNCLNTTECPFWSGYPKIRITNKDGYPNKKWWEKNAYKIPNSPNNARFVIINLSNDICKIIAFAENCNGNQAMISSGYFLK